MVDRKKTIKNINGKGPPECVVCCVYSSELKLLESLEYSCRHHVFLAFM